MIVVKCECCLVGPGCVVGEELFEEFDQAGEIIDSPSFPDLPTQIREAWLKKYRFWFYRILSHIQGG